jgi:TonB-linked SusC/RagA family outer membrane protein
MGYNGSEQFAKENRFGFFPAGSVGWMVSNEKFMKTQKVITNLKLRASYGKVGNDKLGSSRFLYMDNVNVAGSGYSSSLGLGNYVNEILFGNPLITWETSYKQNYGIDLSIFNDLTFTGDYFIENRNNILLNSGTVPALQGIPLTTLPKINVGVVNNQGFELQLAYKKRVNNDLSFNISGNYNYCKNTVINIDEAPNDPSYPYKYLKTGTSLKQNWGMIIDWNSPGHGYWTSLDEIKNSGLKFDGIQPKPGDFVYKDVNGDGIISRKDWDQIKYGALPRITYGLNLSVSYKGFDLSALLQGVAQVSEYYSSWGIMEFDNNGNYYKYMQNAWTPELYNAGATITYPRLTTLQGGSSSEQPNSFFCFDKSYTRLKNAEIGYKIPTKLLKKIGLQSIRIYANGQNLLLWDNLPTKNLDPEQLSALSVPIPRLINFGANIVF